MQEKTIKKLTSWGHVFVGSFKVISLDNSFLNLTCNDKTKLIARGNGRSYYDQSIVKGGRTVSTLSLNKILKFDAENREVFCQSGLTLHELLKVSLPYNLIPLCMPGTKKVTIGGMIASNIHGKNHHQKGGLLNSIQEITIFDGRKYIRCSRHKYRDIFMATIGGMGMTGIIISAKIKLTKIASSAIKVEKKLSQGIENILKDIDGLDHKEYVVTWINLLDKNPQAVSISGEFNKDFKPIENSLKNSYSINVPFINFFSIFINNIFVRPFNYLYLLLARIKIDSYMSIDKFFFPLDRIENFNQVYGKSGLIQFHGVTPRGNFEKFFKELHTIIINSHATPTLSILKKLRKEDHYLSFPIEGFSIAIDFKGTSKNKKLVKKLNKLCSDFGGRVYLAKDSLLDHSLFQKMYPQIIGFEKVRDKYSVNKFKSLLSERLRIR